MPKADPPRRFEPLEDPDKAHALHEDLARTLERVGPQGYFHATARLFAKGGKYNAALKRARYALD